jgi:hypothetical protein
MRKFNNLKPERMTEAKSKSISSLYTLFTVVAFLIHPAIGFAVITFCFLDLIFDFLNLRK